MTDLPAEIDLRCTACGHTQFFDLTRMLQSLLAAGKLKRAKEPPRELVLELFHGGIEEMACRECGKRAYVASAAETWDDDTLAARNCERCGKPIDPDRLEIFPETVLCMNCQRANEQNPGGHEEPDYCPRCGGLMKLRKSTRGVAKYVLACGDCGYK